MSWGRIRRLLPGTPGAGTEPLLSSNAAPQLQRRPSTLKAKAARLQVMLEQMSDECDVGESPLDEAWVQTFVNKHTKCIKIASRLQDDTIDMEAEVLRFQRVLTHPRVQDVLDRMHGGMAAAVDSDDGDTSDAADDPEAHGGETLHVDAQPCSGTDLPAECAIAIDAETTVAARWLPPPKSEPQVFKEIGDGDDDDWDDIEIDFRADAVEASERVDWRCEHGEEEVSDGVGEDDGPRYYIARPSKSKRRAMPEREPEMRPWALPWRPRGLGPAADLSTAAEAAATAAMVGAQLLGLEAIHDSEAHRTQNASMPCRLLGVSTCLARPAVA